MIRVRYVNHEGSEFVLNGDGYTSTNVNALRAYNWSFNSVNRPSGYGGKASGFARRPVTRDITVKIRAFKREDMQALANRLHAITEADIMAEQPGKLYIGNQYIVCYLGVSSTVEQYTDKTSFLGKKLQVRIEEPYWCSEATTIFNIVTVTDTTGKKFDLRLPYRYGSGYASSYIANSHFAACQAIITIYGSVANPSIQIAGHIYNVDVTLTATERLVIDQTKRKIYKVSSTGAQTNVFNARNKGYDVFAPIPVGQSPVIYSGAFKFSITLVQQRSEPLWT